MKRNIAIFLNFVKGSLRIISRGHRVYYAWIILLAIVLIQAVFAYAFQFRTGLVVTGMRDPVSWGMYIGHFTFLVGVAAAAVMLVIPAYMYHWKPIKEVVLFGELLAVSAIIMCIMYVVTDVGRPDRLLRMMPIVGTPNVPSSMLGWDAMVLTAYLLLNWGIATYILIHAFYEKPYNNKVLVPLVLISVPMAIGIHTVTAFLFNGMASRPFWNASILAPRFLASAFCSGPAVLIIVFQILRKISDFKIRDEAIQKVTELMAYAMFINLFLFAAEIYKEFYSATGHLVHYQYLYGLGDFHDSPIAPWAWFSLVAGIAAFVIFLIPRTRSNPITMNIGCVLIFMSVFLEKGVALVVPGYTPDVLGQIYPYFPSVFEFRISAGIFATGALLFTFMVKVATAILFKGFTAKTV